MAKTILIVILFAASFLGPAVANAQPEHQPLKDPNLPTDDQAEVGFWNWKMRTLGGQQFWTDVRHVDRWRVQENSETGHHRLIDPNNVRHAWGNLAHCNKKLNQLIAQGDVKPHSGPVVIVIHGLIRTSASMQTMAKHLSEQGKYTAINFQYASSRKRVAQHAAALKSVIDGLGPEVTEINFVAHSLGNIVIRRYLGDNTAPTTGQQGDSRIHRMVMIGPPNQGSRMARVLKSSLLFHTIAGVSGAELSRTWGVLEPTLATPQFEFGIIAGGQENETDLNNFILTGKDDFTVSVEETKLDGAHDFLVQPLLHSTMMNQPNVLDATLRFFQHGHFISEQERKPLIADGK